MLHSETIIYSAVLIETVELVTQLKTECHRLQLWAQCCDKKPVQIIFCGHTLFERSAQAKYIVAPLIVVGSKHSPKILLTVRSL